MNREEKHELVCQLYKEGRTMREIAKEVHMSFGDIGSITRKLVEGIELNTKEKSKETRALELFKKGKNPVDVSIIMDLNPSEVLKIYNEFWELKGLYQLLELYKMVKADSSILMRVHDVMKRYGFSKKDLVNFVDWAGKFDFLKEEVNELERQFDHLMKQRHIASDSLSSSKKKLEELTNQNDAYDKISAQKRVCIENMNNEIRELESYNLELRNSNECYRKFEKFAAEKLELILKDRRWILASAIDAVVESMKQVQFKEMIFNDTTIQETNKHKLLDLSEILFDKILKELIHQSMQVNSTAGINDDSLASVSSFSESKSKEPTVLEPE
jgi:hypothetical protein